MSTSVENKEDELPEVTRELIEKSKSGYPAIYLLAKEDNRAFYEIKMAAKAMDKPLYNWSYTVGMVKVPLSGNSHVAEAISESESPAQALDVAKALPERSLVHLRLFHKFLDDPGVQVKLLDTVREFNKSKKMLIITSPTVDIPKEIETSVCMISSKLPTRELIRKVVKEVIRRSSEALVKKGVTLPTPAQIEHLVDASMGMSLEEAENAISLSIIRPSSKGNIKGVLNPKIIQDEKCASLRKAGLIEYIENSGALDDIGGLDLLKEWVRKRKNAFTDEARTFGLPQPKGILLVGPPGSGKSVTAKAVSGELGLPLLRLDMGKMFGSLVGQSENNMRDAISAAETMSPCVLWIDEIEKGFAGTGGSGSNDSGVGSRVLGTCLTWLQEKTSPVFVFATANDVTALPPELLRKGRLDELFHVAYPNEEERKDIFRIHLRKKKREALIAKGDIDIELLAKTATDFSGAEIEACINEALYMAFSCNRDLQTQDIMGSLKNCVPLAKQMKDKLEALDRWCKGKARPASSPKITQVSNELSGRTVEA